jgi:hypothetical protein
MTDITLCLITKGRPEYLDQLLESFDQVVEYPYVKFLIILNGTSEEVRDSFESWASAYRNRVEVHFFKENDGRLATFLPVIKSIKSDWVCFPSDDDIVEKEFFGQWEGFISNFNECGAIATSLNLIDEQGKLLGILKKPSYKVEMPSEQRAAKSFSECPFLWPGLIIKVDQLPMSVPSTRYVSDWWIGLHLIFTSNVRVDNSVFTRYRVHGQQESNVSSLSRKNLEALIHLGAFVRSEEFSNWIMELEVTQVIGFLESLIKYPPIYGDPKFSGEFVSLVTGTVEAIRGGDDIRSVSKLVNAYSHGVIIDDSQSIYLEDSRIDLMRMSVEINLKLVFNEMCCETIKSVQDGIKGISLIYPAVLVGCLHTNNSENNVVLNCEALHSRPQILDALAQGANEYLQKSGVFDSSVSQFEYSLVLRVRRLKKYIPSYLIKRLYRLKPD